MVGGVLFVLPVAIVLTILGYALRLASMVAQPISDKLQLQNDLTGVGIVTLLSVLGAGLPSPRALPLAPIWAGASRAGSKVPCLADCPNTRW